ncbi:Ribosomal RNA small subunit methyltransferase [Arachis hypogaea]|nr:Ribosomal RNA small subunit methyltransferase [Arachis hypogaea]
MMGLAGISVAPCYQGSKGGIYFILQNASLVAAYVGKRYQILNPDEHANLLRRKNKNPYDYRPDIVHEALLQIMGSRLCIAGRVHGVFIKTDEGILIRVEANTQIPKTLGSFCNMMAELLEKFSIKSKGNYGKLLCLIENPVTQHLPVNSRKIGLSVNSPKAVQINDYVTAANHDENLVFVVGAMAHGKIDAEYVDDLISVSTLSLSTGTCLRRICVALEKNQKIH